MIANLLLSLTVNQSDCLIQRLNLCYNLSNFRCFDTAAEKLDEMWMGRPVYFSCGGFSLEAPWRVAN